VLELFIFKIGNWFRLNYLLLHAVTRIQRCNDQRGHFHQGVGEPGLPRLSSPFHIPHPLPAELLLCINQGKQTVALELWPEIYYIARLARLLHRGIPSESKGNPNPLRMRKKHQKSK
jgi:hypothetical protein